MKTAILASEHYFSQRMAAPSALWFNLDETIKTKEGYEQWLAVSLPLFKAEGITRVFGLTDLTALVAAHCEFLMGNRSHDSFMNIARCLNKPLVRSLIGDTAYNVKTVNTFPAFVKPIHSSLSQGSGFIRNAQEYQEHLDIHAAEVYGTTEKYRVFGQVAGIDFTERFHEFYAEECIADGTQLTADVIVKDGQITVLSVSESVFHEELPSFSYFDFPYECSEAAMQEIEAASSDITSLLQLDDLLFNIEFIWTMDNELKLIEVNPRPATQFLPAIKAVKGFDGWKYLESGIIEFMEPATSHLAIKIFRTKTDSFIDHVPSESVVDELKANLGGVYNSFVNEGTNLSDYQQDGYTYRVGEAYLPYNSRTGRDLAFKEALNILESENTLIQAGEII